jgi:response regulator RpfG family c-di-GMP phosphodiesterase
MAIFYLVLPSPAQILPLKLTRANTFKPPRGVPMDGFELYDKIRKIDKKVSVFFISTFEVDRAAISKQYPGLKIENILPKPIQIPELIKRVEEQL